MTSRNKEKFVEAVAADTDVIAARAPFKVQKDERRRYVRIDISSPMTLKKIKEANGQFHPEGEWHTINGHILNLSASGVLLDLDQQLKEGDIVALHFVVQDVETLSDILGLVKRADSDGEGVIAGVEFINRDDLSDRLTQGEIDLLPETLNSFDETIRQVLNNYVYRETDTTQN